MLVDKACQQSSGRFEHLLGIGLVFTVALIWTIASFVSQHVVSEVDPFLFTYLGNTLFTFYLPVSLVNKWMKRSYSERRLRSYHNVELRLHHQHACAGAQEERQEETLERESQAFYAALWVAPLWFLANWLYNMSFLTTSATSNAILSQTSALFTYGLSVWLLGEHYSNVKLLYVVLTIAGVALVAFKDHAENTTATGQDRSIWGDIVCVMGACVYGLYSVIMRKKLGNEHHADVAMFFGYIGLFTTFLLTPLIFLLAMAGFYKKEHIFICRKDLGLIAGEGLIDNVIADFLLAKAVLLVGPTLTSLGMASTIPMTAVGEVLLSLHAISMGHSTGRKALPTWVRKPGLLILTLFGTLCVMLGFFGFNQQSAQHEEAQEEGVELSEELDLGPQLSPRRSPKLDSPMRLRRLHLQ